MWLHPCSRYKVHDPNLAAWLILTPIEGYLLNYAP